MLQQRKQVGIHQTHVRENGLYLKSEMQFIYFPRFILFSRANQTAARTHARTHARTWW